MDRARAQEYLSIALPGARVHDVRPCTGGETSSVYEVRCGDPVGQVILKRYRSDWRRAKEQHVYGLLAARPGLPLPAVLGAGPGFLVLSRLPGQTLSTVVVGDPGDVYRQLGALLATVHTITMPGYGYLTTRLHDPRPDNEAYLAARFAALLAEHSRLDGEADVRRRVEWYLADHLPAAATCTGAVLCHNDFHEGNVLVDGRGRVTGIVDMENAIAGDPVLDIAKTWSFSIREDATKWAGLRDGYGTLPKGWRDRLGLWAVYHALELWTSFAAGGRLVPLPGLTADLRRFTAESLDVPG